MAKINSLEIKLNNLAKINTKKMLTKACLLVEAAAKEKCPVDTGELRNSITFSVDDKEGQVGTNKAYAPYVEYGTGLFAANGDGRKDVPWRYMSPDGKWHTTSGQQPQPFLGPALEENKKEIVNMFQNEIKEAINGRRK